MSENTGERLQIEEKVIATLPASSIDVSDLRQIEVVKQVQRTADTERTHARLLLGGAWNTIRFRDIFADNSLHISLRQLLADHIYIELRPEATIDNPHLDEIIQMPNRGKPSLSTDVHDHAFYHEMNLLSCPDQDMDELEMPDTIFVDDTDDIRTAFRAAIAEYDGPFAKEIASCDPMRNQMSISSFQQAIRFHHANIPKQVRTRFFVIFKKYLTKAIRKRWRSGDGIILGDTKHFCEMMPEEDADRSGVLHARTLWQPSFAVPKF